jgi:hypothetical protein
MPPPPTPGWMLPPWVVRGAAVVCTEVIQVPFGLPPSGLEIARGEKGRVLSLSEDKVRVYVGPDRGAAEWTGLFEPEEPYIFIDQHRAQFTRSWDRVYPQDVNNLGVADYVRQIEVGGERFDLLCFCSSDRRKHLNIEPSREFGSWKIISFVDPGRNTTKRVVWSRRCEWVLEGIADPSTWIQTCELDFEVQRAVESLPAKLVPK